MVKDVSFDDAVEQLAADEAELAVDSGCGAACEIPRLTSVVWERRISVLEVGNGN